MNPELAIAAMLAGAALTVGAAVVAPAFMLRVIIALIPKSDDRWRELQGELHCFKRWEQPIFVLEQIRTSIVEGTRLRWDAHKRARLKTDRQKENIWVPAYQREDGLLVRGHYRKPPKRVIYCEGEQDLQIISSHLRDQANLIPFQVRLKQVADQ